MTVLDNATSVARAEAEARTAAEARLAVVVKQQAATATELAKLQSQLAALQVAQPLITEAPVKPSVAARQAFIERARAPRPLSEVQARKNIDRMLRASG